MELQSLKQRFDIVGDDPVLDDALNIALQVSSTDLSVLVVGESGVGKEVIPKIIHQNSPRKHESYIAVNCGAIPEGTIDSELFGHEKGSFTGANETRKGYFEVADGGTIFLDEVGELPLSTQVRLLRVLQNGEFLKVGSSKVQKTNVRVVAATNVNLMNAVRLGKFREDLYYRLAMVPITLPPLRERKGDIYLLFRKFALDFADKYNIPGIKLTHEAQVELINYRWPGNVRQLKSVAEQMSILEKEREVGADALSKYLPKDGPEALPVLASASGQDEAFINDKEVLYKLVFSLKQEVDALKDKINRIMSSQDDAAGVYQPTSFRGTALQQPRSTSVGDVLVNTAPSRNINVSPVSHEPEEKEFDEVMEQEPESLSIRDKEAELIRASLEKNKGRRKASALELGISERTLYRKIKELGLEKKRNER
ncbi:MAG: sigma-54 interaction domain-containing protein [Candidatus Egerieousia sp.]